MQELANLNKLELKVGNEKIAFIDLLPEGVDGFKVLEQGAKEAIYDIYLVKDRIYKVYETVSNLVSCQGFDLFMQSINKYFAGSKRDDIAFVNALYHAFEVALQRARPSLRINVQYFVKEYYTKKGFLNLSQTFVKVGGAKLVSAYDLVNERFLYAIERKCEGSNVAFLRDVEEQALNDPRLQPNQVSWDHITYLSEYLSVNYPDGKSDEVFDVECKKPYGENSLIYKSKGPSKIVIHANVTSDGAATITNIGRAS